MACEIGLVIDDLDAATTLDVFSIADMTNAEGLLGGAPTKGDLIEMAWLPGAEWQGGPRGPYSFDMPLVMDGDTLTQRLTNLRTFQALEGHRVRLTRTLQLAGGPVVEVCTGVVASATQVSWDLRERNWLRCVLVVQVLVPWAAA